MTWQAYLHSIFVFLGHFCVPCDLLWIILITNLPCLLWIFIWMVLLAKHTASRTKLQFKYPCPQRPFSFSWCHHCINHQFVLYPSVSSAHLYNPHRFWRADCSYLVWAPYKACFFMTMSKLSILVSVCPSREKRSSDVGLPKCKMQRTTPASQCQKVIAKLKALSPSLRFMLLAQMNMKGSIFLMELFRIDWRDFSNIPAVNVSFW